MSRKKYVVESAFENISVQKIMQIAIDANGRIVNWTDSAENIEELNSDYINEHFGDLQDEAYRQGSEELRGVLIEILEADTDTRKKYMDYIGIIDILVHHSASKIVEKWQARKKDDEIKVGDEVRWGMDLIVITRLYMDGGFKWCDGISKDGIAFHVLEENVSKTNRHFDIEKILEEMKE